MTNSNSTDILRWVALVAVTLVVSWFFLDMVQPFLVSLFLAAIATAMSARLQARMMIITRRRKTLSAFLTILVLGIAVVAPLLGLIWLAASQAQGMTEAASGLFEELSELSADEPLPDWVPFPDLIGQYSATITAKIGEIASAVGQFMVSMLGEMTKGTAQFFMDLFIFFYAFFIFLQMDRPVIDQVLSYSGLAPETQAALEHRIVSVSRATIKGTLLIGVAQGTLGGLGLWVAGVGGAAFWGVVMAVLSIIPGLGPLVVIFAAVIWLATQGAVTPAIGLAIWGVAVVGTIDNILRPILVGRDAALNDIIILVSTLGGLAFFGASGLVLGPVLAGIFVTLWDTLAENSDARATPPEEQVSPAEEVPPEDGIMDEELSEELADLRQRKAAREAKKDGET